MSVPPIDNNPAIPITVPSVPSANFEKTQQSPPTISSTPLTTQDEELVRIGAPLANLSSAAASAMKQQKRNYFAVTQSQIDLLKNYYATHHDDWSPIEYSSRTGIRIGNCRNLLMKLKRNKTIDKIEYQRGRKRLLNKEHAIQLYEMIQNNSKTNLREMYSKLSPIKGKNGVTYKPSLSTVYRFIHNGGFEKWGIPRITFKKINPISNISNNEYIKHTRVQYISDYSTLSSQYVPVWIDECEWQISDVKGDGWKTSNKPGVEFTKCISIQFHMCLAITSAGCYPEIFVGSNSEADIFDSYIRSFTGDFKTNNCLYLIDSERTVLIDKLKSIIRDSDKILGIPPGSCVLSPVEKIYEIFKTDYLPKINGKNVEELLKMISDEFVSVGKDHAKEALEYVFNEIYPKVQKHEDLDIPLITATNIIPSSSSTTSGEKMEEECSADESSPNTASGGAVSPPPLLKPPPALTPVQPTQQQSHDITTTTTNIAIPVPVQIQPIITINKPATTGNIDNTANNNGSNSNKSVTQSVNASTTQNQQQSQK